MAEEILFLQNCSQYAQYLYTALILKSVVGIIFAAGMLYFILEFIRAMREDF